MSPIDNIRCLMIGQAGIGKTTLLHQLAASNTMSFDEKGTDPRTCATETASTATAKCAVTNGGHEIFALSGSNTRVEIVNSDVTLATCLHDTDLIVANGVLNASGVINTCSYSVLVMCYDVDDSTSFELIKSKWQVDLKKNKNGRHAFVLLGIRGGGGGDGEVNVESQPDTVIRTSLTSDAVVSSSPHSTMTSHHEINTKWRSCSVSSNSSTSRLHQKKSEDSSGSSDFGNGRNSRAGLRQRQIKLRSTFAFDPADESGLSVSKNASVKLAKTIGAVNVRCDIFRGWSATVFTVTSGRRAAKTTLPSIQCAKSMLVAAISQAWIKQRSQKTPTSMPSLTVRIPRVAVASDLVTASNTALKKSLSMPFNLVVNYWSRRQQSTALSRSCQLMNGGVEQNGAAYASEHNATDDNQLDIIRLDDDDHERGVITMTKTTTAANSSLSVRSKISRLAVDFGTYLVTCGTHKTRRLNELKNIKGKNDIGGTRLLIKTSSGDGAGSTGIMLLKNRSWSPLASEASLNGMETNDDETSY